MSFDLSIRGRAEPRLLSSIVRLVAWQGAALVQLNFQTRGDDIRIYFTVDCDAWKATRLVVHSRKIPGIISVGACDSATGQPPEATAVAPLAR